MVYANWSQIVQNQIKVYPILQKKSLEHIPALYLDNHELEVVDTLKILGLVFDTRLTWTPHLKYLRWDCYNRLNIVKSLAKRNWGADKTLLINTYKAIVRTKLDYGYIIYNSTKPNVLGMISPIHNAGLRIAIGALFPSPISSILSEAGESPLNYRRKQLTLIYATAIASTPSNPTHENIFQGNYQHKYYKHEKASRPFYMKVNTYLQEINFTFPKIAYRKVRNFPFWKYSVPTIITTLCELPKKQSNSNEYKSVLTNILNSLPNYTQIYTDR